LFIATNSHKFTLRFQREETHDLLRMVADRFGVSMNALAEEMISRELQAIGLSIEQDLYGTLDLIHRYRGEDAQAGLDAFARGEAVEDDPLRSHMATQAQTTDAFGVAAAFS
jgi:hypothetical protein